MTDQIFLSELDQEILYMLARGKTQEQIAESSGRSVQSIWERIRNMKGVFGAVTTPHLIAIAIASDVISVPDLYDETLAEAVYIRSEGKTMESFHLQSKRLEILQAVMA